MVEQTNARDRLPDLQDAADEDEAPVQSVEKLSLARQSGSSQSLALSLREDNVIAEFQHSVQNSLRSIHEPSERRAIVLQSSVNWLRDLLIQWTTLGSESLNDNCCDTGTKDGNPAETVSEFSETEIEVQRLVTGYPPLLGVSNSGKPISNTTKGEASAGKASSLDEKEADVELSDLDWVDRVFRDLSVLLIPSSIGSETPEL